LNAEADLTATFAALADPTRRSILDRLAAEGEVTVTDLAAPLPISLQAVSMHLKTLEQAGLVIRIRRGQQRPARLAGPALRDATDWLGRYRHFWESSFEALEARLNDE
jgi:DNA-binding transcriptional ArsR family regulator